jgi:hypothetical protein
VANGTAQPAWPDHEPAHGQARARRVTRRVTRLESMRAMNPQRGEPPPVVPQSTYFLERGDPAHPRLPERAWHGSLPVR